ncbi:hypothetical protein B7463_g3584, partial [Scytalidium lignicola]
MLYRIGVDVGGTNTDAALARAVFDQSDTSTNSNPHVEIAASFKSPTTPDITSGICNSVRGLLEQTRVQPDDIISVNIGTTHFINAIIQVDRSKLSRVAVLRLCGPFARAQAPFTDFPPQLRNAVEGPVGYLAGGLEVDGRLISKIDEEEVRRHAKLIQDRGVDTVVVIGVFSTLDTSEPTQEEHVKAILQQCIPNADVVCSRDVGSAGFIERENASILNASILRLARETIYGFQEAVSNLGLGCPLYLTQNDGTAMAAQAASVVPIKTFSSGATNSLTGAVFLSGIHLPSSKTDLEKSQVIMIDIGGTSADFAALSSTGFPRQSPAIVKVGGVRTAFSMPEVLSLGLGGGSRVHENEDGTVVVGPDSVGYQILTSAQCFGGSVLTATDIVVASGFDVGITPKWEISPPLSVVEKARAHISSILKKGIDSMKTSDLDVVALLVGGGSIIQIDKLENVKECVRVPFFDAANAVGAAIAKVSGDVDRISVAIKRSHEQMVEDLKEQAIQLAINNGAQPSTIRIVQLDLLPLPYIGDNAFRAVIKAVGELGWERQVIDTETLINEIHISPRTNGYHEEKVYDDYLECDPLADPNLRQYEPTVSKETGEWFLSEIDLAFISEGVCIIGTGGGGTVRPTYLDCLNRLRTCPKGRMRIIDPESLPDTANIAPLAFVGAPTVTNERLLGNNELVTTVNVLARYLNIQKFDGFIGPEIGGSNGMTSLAAGACMDIPVVDADCLGRAFPRIDLALPYVYEKAVPWPSSCADARENIQIIVSSQSSARFESMERAMAIETGLYNAMTLAPFSGDVVRKYCVGRSLSVCWSIGREVHLARLEKTDVTKAIVSVIPGAVELFAGKIVDISRKEESGWTVGTVTIEGCNEDGDIDATARPLIITFQNEFLYAAKINLDKTRETVCTTPDLISLLDQDGMALGTHEIRYGLRVSVLGMPAHRLWKTEEGMRAAGPASFGLDVPYQSMKWEWKEPESVIKKYGK